MHGKRFRLFAQEFSDRPGSDCGNERGERADEHVVHQKGGGEVGEHTAQIQGGDRLDVEEGENTQRFGGTDLQESLVGKRPESVSKRNVQRGDDARAADALGGKDILHMKKPRFFYSEVLTENLPCVL